MIGAAAALTVAGTVSFASPADAQPGYWGGGGRYSGRYDDGYRGYRGDRGWRGDRGYRSRGDGYRRDRYRSRSRIVVNLGYGYPAYGYGYGYNPYGYVGYGYRDYPRVRRHRDCWYSRRLDRRVCRWDRW